MKKILKTIIYLTSLMFFSCHVETQSNADEIQSKIVMNENGAAQLIVNGKPFIMLAGELHNSSASTVGYTNQLWSSLKALNLNTVLATIAWEQFEPQEGVYDYTLVDNLISGARKNDMKLVLLWFASWKNGESSYIPAWIKRDDTNRFRRVITKEGKEIEIISPFCENTMKADAKAFAALMRHIKKTDGNTGTVIAMQPENEVGIFQDIDYIDISLKKFEQQVPQELFQFMQNNRTNLREELSLEWEKQGSKTSGTWKEVFGNTPSAKNFFTTWQFASYVNYVAKAGRDEYNLPMFVNCWLVQNPDDLPGVYPNGGPVSRVMDIWKAAAPAIDVLSPDIYLSDFKNIVKDYHRADNPLLIPEARMREDWAFYAFGEHHALCFAPFGIESGAGNHSFAGAYQVLHELMPLITQYQGSERMIGILKDPDVYEQMRTMGNYNLRITPEKEGVSYGIIIQTDDHEFIVAGQNLMVSFSSNTEKTGRIMQVFEGGFDNGEWKTTRMLNGDETYHNAVLRVKGRQTDSSESAGIYKVITYLR